MEKDGHSVGGMAVTCVCVLKADDTKRRKGSRENITVRVIPNNRAILVNQFFVIDLPPEAAFLPGARI